MQDHRGQCPVRGVHRPGMRHALPCRAGAKAPLPRVLTAFVARTVPLPRVSTAFVAKTLPLPHASTALHSLSQYLSEALGGLRSRWGSRRLRMPLRSDGPSSRTRKGLHQLLPTGRVHRTHGSPMSWPVVGVFCPIIVDLYQDRGSFFRGRAGPEHRRRAAGAPAALICGQLCRGLLR